MQEPHPQQTRVGKAAAWTSLTSVLGGCCSLGVGAWEWGQGRAEEGRLVFWRNCCKSVWMTLGLPWKTPSCA